MATAPSNQDAEAKTLTGRDNSMADAELGDYECHDLVGEDGDVVLVLRKCPDDSGKGVAEGPPIKLLCDSKVLSDASKVFKKMFGPDFKEGKLIREGNQPEITLWEDEPTCMMHILYAIHIDDGMPDLPVCGGTYFWWLAEQINKYDCGKAILPYIRKMCEQAVEQAKAWRSSRYLGSWRKLGDPADEQDEWDGLLRLAVYLYPDIPETVARELIGSARPLWVLDLHEKFRLVSPLHSAIARYSHCARQHMTYDLYSVTKDVLLAEEAWSGAYCSACRAWEKNPKAATCSVCGRGSMEELHCNWKTRTSLYIWEVQVSLQLMGLDPVIESSPRDILDGASLALDYLVLKHSPCPANGPSRKDAEVKLQQLMDVNEEARDTRWHVDVEVAKGEALEKCPLAIAGKEISDKVEQVLDQQVAFFMQDMECVKREGG